MKEVTKWDNNPRMMWCWDNGDEGDKVQSKVIYIIDPALTKHPVVTISNDGYHICRWAHCAEIKEEESRRYTNQELAWWLQDGIKEGKHREWSHRFLNDTIVHSHFDYCMSSADKLVDEDILIREDGGEWREPLAEPEDEEDYLW